MVTALKVLGFVWSNRKGIMKGYHHFVKHGVLLDQLVDLGADHPDHPANKNKTTEG